jgi:NADH:ubiquinone oxidoreductase subunit F (NADH-binding)/NADH:ubiquinone oxidoreductase subunit E
MSAASDASIDLALLDPILEQYAGQPGALIPVLQKAQAIYGYLPPEVLQRIATRLRVSPAQVYGVATFYSMWDVGEKRPQAVGLCDDGPCHTLGAADVRRALEEAGLAVRRTSCLGQCGRGPVVTTTAGTRYRQVTPRRIHAILEGKEPPPSSPADEIIGLELPDPTHALLRNVGKIDPRSLEEAVAAGAYQALRKALTTMTPEQVISEVIRSGLQGRGGAGFPAGLKMRFTAAGKAADGIAYVICNADESEPGTFKDRLLIEGDPHQLLEGMAIAGYAIGAHRGYIYIRGEYGGPAALLEQSIQDAERSGYLGQHMMSTGFDFHVHLHRGAGAYVCGEETALLESLEGKRGEPRLRPPYPTTCGLFGRATLVNNVETLCNVPGIVANGADWYRQAGTEKSPGTKLYPVSGHVRRTGCLETSLGQMTLRQVIEGPAGGMRGEAPFKACHLGGAAGAIVGPEFLEVPLDFGSCAAAGAMLGAGDIVVLDTSTCLVDYLQTVAAFFRAESCGKCTPCRVGTERYVQILADLAGGRGTPDQLDELICWGELMADSSFCGLGQTAPVAVMAGLQRFREEFAAHTRGQCPAGVCRLE